MTHEELTDLRRAKWHLDGRAIRTREDARAFLESVGFCLMYPQKPAPLLPTFIGAYAGSEDHLPTWQQAFADSRSAEATALMVRLLRERDAYEANLFGENNPLLISGTLFPYFYALAGERNPKQAPKAGPRSEYSELACDAFAAIQRGGPISKLKLQETLGGSISVPALDRALGELAAKLRITRVDYNTSEGSFWDVLYRWSPDAVREGNEHSVPAALSACLSRYLDGVVAASQQDLEGFLGRFGPGSRVREAVHALLAARELEFLHVGGSTLIQLTPPRVPFIRKESVRATPAQPPLGASVTNKPVTNKLATNRPVPMSRPEVQPTGSGGTKFQRPPLQKSGFQNPSFKKTSGKKSGFSRPGFSKSSSDGSGSGGAKFGKSGFSKSGSSKSFTKFRPTNQNSRRSSSPGSQPSRGPRPPRSK